MKKISILLAVLISLTMVITACNKKVENSKASETSSSDKDSSSDDKSSTDDDSQDTTKADGKPGETTTAKGGELVFNKETTAALTEMPQTSKVKHGYNSLNADEKDLYSRILNAADNFQPTVTFKSEIPFTSYQKVFGLVYFQEPQLFWLDGTYEIVDGKVSSTTLYFHCNKDEAVKKQAEIDAKVKEIMAAFPKNATTNDKLKVFHDYVIKHCSFTKDGTYVQTIYGALVEGKVQCEGYAKVMGYLCDKAGIENMLIVGTNNQKASHAWNLVKVDGDWYNIDLTWDDPANKTDPNYVRYTYFNVTDAEILNKTHFQDLTYFTPPKATATKANYQMTYGYYAKSYDEAMKIIKDDLIKASAEKRGQIQVKVSSKAVLDELNTKLVSQAGIYAVLKDANKSAKNKFSDSNAAAEKDENVLSFQLLVQYQ